jgi:DNA-binding NtrC family response regulator/tetratricopeptide (TPR) repeat protein
VLPPNVASFDVSSSIGQRVQRLVQRGLLTQALHVLTPRLDRRDPVMLALCAELLRRADRLEESEAHAYSALECQPQHLAACSQACETLGLLAGRRHEVASAEAYFDTALAYAHKASDSRRACEVLLASLSFRLDVRGVAGVSELAGQARRAVLRTGDPALFAALHLRFASIEMRRGDGALSARHLDAAAVALEAAPNSYLTARRLAASSITNWLRDRVEASFTDGEAALKLATKDDHPFIRMAVLSNLALFTLATGDSARCAALLREAVPLVRGAHVERSVLDTKAQWHLAENDLAGAEACIRQISRPNWEEGDVEATWPDVEIDLTRVEILRRRGRIDRALLLAQKAAATARDRNEWLIAPVLTLRHAELLLDTGAVDAAERALGPLLDRKGTLALHVVADIERLKGRILTRSGRVEAGRSSFARGQRIAIGLGRALSREDAAFAAGLDGKRETKAGGWSAIEGLGVCSQLVSRPDLHGRELVEMLVDSGAVTRAACVAAPAEPSRAPRRASAKKGSVPAAEATVVDLGRLGEHAYHLHVEAKSDVNSRALVGAVCKLVTDSLELHRLREEAKHRTSLWPREEGLLLEQNLFVAPRMREVQATARRAGASEHPVLITGETGVGKEIVAREVHESSARARTALGVLVCSGVPRELLDSQLFGHRRGAFAGASDDSPGQLRVHDGGTLLLDDVGHMSLDLQVKLLRFLETGEVHPVGGVRSVPADVRIIATTTQSLETLLKEGRFREDLFYRLNVVRVAIPPLRERREEILPFFERFLLRECARLGRSVPDLSDEAIEHLLLFKWPGNVRQVLNEAKRVMATLSAGEPITPAALSSDIAAERRAAMERAVAATPDQILIRTDQSLAAAVEQLERAMLAKALANSRDFESAAAKLDITRKGLFLKRQRLGIDFPQA